MVNQKEMTRLYEIVTAVRDNIRYAALVRVADTNRPLTSGKWGPDYEGKICLFAAMAEAACRRPLASTECNIAFIGSRLGLDPTVVMQAYKIWDDADDTQRNEFCLRVRAFVQTTYPPQADFRADMLARPRVVYGKFEHIASKVLELVT